MSLFGSLMAGAAQGAGAGIANVGQQNLQAQLAEMRAKNDYDRQVALDAIRGQREDARFDKQMAIQGQWRAEDVGLRREEFQERRADRKEAREERQADRVEQRQWRVEDRDLAFQDRREARSSAAADRAAARADNKEYRDAMIGLREKELGLRDGGLPPELMSQYKGFESELDDIRAQQKDLTKSGLTSPDVAMNPNMKAGVEAELKRLDGRANDLRMRQQRLLYDAGKISTKGVLEPVAGRFSSREEVDSFVNNGAKAYGERFRTEAMPILEELGVLKRVGEAKPAQAAPTAAAPGAPLMSRPVERPVDSRPGFRDIELSPRELEMQRDYDNAQARSRINRPLMAGPINVETADLESVRSALASGQLSGRQQAIARSRLRAEQ